MARDHTPKERVVAKETEEWASAAPDTSRTAHTRRDAVPFAVTQELCLQRFAGRTRRNFFSECYAVVNSLA